ncbi:hypothetical protein ACSBR1_027270 [Camellia fascicularis]
MIGFSVPRKLEQVEHPVTEWIAEINLPAAQVAVGTGIPLWQIPGIILPDLGVSRSIGYVYMKDVQFNREPLNAKYRLSDLKKIDKKVRHHFHDDIAVRVTSEDPDDGFKPISGKVQIDMVRGGPGSYSLKMNQSEIGAEIHTLRDGGLLSWPKFCNKCKELRWMHLLTLHVSNINIILL